MRRLAAFQAMVAEATPALLDGAGSIIQAWIDSKFIEENGITVIRGSRRPGTFELRENDLEGHRRLRLTTLEHGDDDAWQFETVTNILFDGIRLYLRTEVLLGQEQRILSAKRAQARAPRFFGEIVALPGMWCFDEGADRILPRVHRVRRGEVDLLEGLLTSDARRLPMVLVSSVAGSERFEGFSCSLQRATLGLAHVVIVDEMVSRSLTERFGERWSCYGRAVRVFWPRRFLRGSPYDHPLHLADRMPETCVRAVDVIVAPLIEGSSFVGGYPALDRFEADLARAEFDRTLAESRRDLDYDRLEEVYAKENDRLEAENARLRDEVEEIRQRLEEASARSALAAPKGADDQEATLTTVVADFRSRHGDLLVFADDWQEQVKTINPDGYSPGELEAGLDLLLRMARTLRETSGSLGVQPVIWCREQGFECSSDSETDKKADAHAWRIEGRRESFNTHLKPTDRTAPDRCVRIYFKTLRDPWRVAVGYVGSKKGL